MSNVGDIMSHDKLFETIIDWSASMFLNERVRNEQAASILHASDSTFAFLAYFTLEVLRPAIAAELVTALKG